MADLPKVLMSLYVKLFDDKDSTISVPLVLVVSRHAGAADPAGAAAPFLVSGVEVSSKQIRFEARLRRDQLDALIKAVVGGDRKLRVRTGGAPAVEAPVVEAPVVEAPVVTQDADGDVVVISDPGGGKGDGPKVGVLAALAVDPETLSKLDGSGRAAA